MLSGPSAAGLLWPPRSSRRKQRPGSVAGCRQVAAYRGEGGRPDVARGAVPELIGLACPDVHGAATGGGLRLHVAVLQRRHFADPRQRVAHEADDGAVAYRPSVSHDGRCQAQRGSVAGCAVGVGRHPARYRKSVHAAPGVSWAPGAGQRTLNAGNALPTGRGGRGVPPPC